MVVELEPEPPCPRHTDRSRAVEGGRGRSDEATGHPSSQEHKRASVHAHNVDGPGGFVHAGRGAGQRAHRGARVYGRQRVAGRGTGLWIARAVHAGPIAALSLTARVGSFIDEGAIVGGARGFVFGASLAARTPTASIAQLGADTSAGQIGLDFTLETTGYVGSHSPLAVGSPWGGVTGLLGLRFGIPTARASAADRSHGILGHGHGRPSVPRCAVRAPLARRERHP